jgi:hypothetical protein
MTYFSNVILPPSQQLIPSSHRSTGVREIAQLATYLSAVMSALLGSLIILFAVFDAPGYRNPLAISYSVAFAVSAYGTWRKSRAAAIGALVLYISLHHTDCGLLRLALHMSIFSTLAAGVWSVIAFHRMASPSRLD